MGMSTDFSGVVHDLVIRRGTTAREQYTAIYDTDEVQITTISAARMTCRSGAVSDESPGTAVVGLTITPTTTGTTITWEMTPTNTRLFDAGEPYWYQIEFDTADGKTWTLCVGDITVSAEGVS